MVSHITEDMGIRLPQGATSSIHRLRYQGYQIVSYCGIWVLRSNLLCYLLLCLILRPGWYLELFSNPSNGIAQPKIEPEKKERILAFGTNIKKRGKTEGAWSGVLSLTVFYTKFQFAIGKININHMICFIISQKSIKPLFFSCYQSQPKPISSIETRLTVENLYPIIYEVILFNLFHKSKFKKV